MSILKINKILVVIVELCPLCDERSANIHEISASFHKEAGEILQGHNEVQAQAAQYRHQEQGNGGCRQTVPARNEKTWVPAEQQLTVIGVSGSYRQGWSRCPKDRLARMPEGKSHKFIPRERFSQSHLGDC